MTEPGLEALLARLQALHPRRIDLSLERMHRLLAALDHPERRLPAVVHIAGTNGKGSTLAFLHAILEAAGLRVHRYVSPHLVDFRERILIRGRPVDAEALAEALRACELANDGAPITFFEITTAAAFRLFAREPADLLLLETGLGGRLDATNVIPQPHLTLISTIARDHEQHLGPTIRQIAFEKAGIMRPGVPVLIGRQRFAEAVEVLEGKAAELKAPVFLMGRDFDAGPAPEGALIYRDREGMLPLPPPCLPGLHQYDNAGLAVAAARLLARTFPLSREAIAEGLRRAHWPARLQHLTQGRLVALLPPGFELWLDGGHNPDAAAALAASLPDLLAGRPLHLVVGMLANKDAEGFLAPLLPLATSLRAVPVGEDHAFHEPRALAERAAAAGLAAGAFGDVAAALRDLAARELAPGVVLVCGSLYLAGAVLRANGTAP